MSYGSIPQEIKDAFEKIKPYCAEVEYVDSGAFQGGEEECFLKGAKIDTPLWVFSPDMKPFVSEDE